MANSSVSQSEGNVLSAEHPLWSVFFDSNSMSARDFFGVRNNNNGIRSPRPWRGRDRLEQRVSQIITSFGEGAFTYNPFRRKIELDRNNNSSSSIINNYDITNRPVIRRRRRNSNNSRNISDSINSNNNSSSNNNNKRRLYGLEPGRPRPFYGRTILDNENICCGGQLTPKTLQDSVRCSLISTYGLPGTNKIMLNNNLQVPKSICHQILTLPCQDFQDVFSPWSSNCSNRSAGSFRVRHLQENREGGGEGPVYLATFAKSQADEATGNLWEEWQYWLNPATSEETEISSSLLKILCLAFDPKTENIFFITEDYQRTLVEDRGRLDSICQQVLSRDDKQSDLLKHLLTHLLKQEGNSLFVVTKESVTSKPVVRYQNPIIFRSFRSHLKNVPMEKHRDIAKKLFDKIREIAIILQNNSAQYNVHNSPLKKCTV